MPGLIEKAVGRNAGLKRLRFPSSSVRDIPSAMAKEISQRARKEAEKGFPFLPLSLYRDFSRSGCRTRYEEPYFHKRRLLSDLVIAEAIEDRGELVDLIEDGIWSILSEPSWTMPAHNTYIRDEDALDTPLIERPILDLFQCETGEILALSISMMEKRISPVLAKDVEYEIRRRILEPYITDHFWWMGSDGPLNNWAPWCTENVLLSTLSIPLGEKEASKVLRMAITTLDQYIEGFPDDGCCDEGASYYHAAALALWGCLDIISKSTGADLKRVWSDPKIRAMAEYIEKVHIEGDSYLNFADCSPKAGTLTAREYLFGKAIGSERLMHHAAIDAAGSWRESDNDYNLFYKYLALSHAKEIEAEAARSVEISPQPFTAFPRAGLAIYRWNGIVFAIKGGSNGESHNHNDVGSFILYRDGRPCLIDIGVETYTKTTFSKDRYTLKPMQSGYHNLVNFPPLEQHDGEEYRASVLRMDKDGAAFDLTRAYPEGGGLRRYIRSVQISDDSIAIDEDFDADQDGVLSLISQEKPMADGGAIRWDSFSAEFPEAIEAEIEILPVTDQRLRKAWPERLYRTLVRLPRKTTWAIHFE